MSSTEQIKQLIQEEILKFRNENIPKLPEISKSIKPDEKSNVNTFDCVFDGAFDTTPFDEFLKQDLSDIKKLSKNYLKRRDLEGYTLIHKVVQIQEIQKINFILESQHTLCPKYFTLADNGGNTVVHHLMKNTNTRAFYAAFSFIEKHYPDLLKTKNNKGDTILRLVLENPNFEIANFLFKSKHMTSLYSEKNNSGRTVLTKLMSIKDFDFFKMIFDLVTDFDPELVTSFGNDGCHIVFSIMDNDNFDCFKFLFDTLYNVCPGMFLKKDNNNNTFLHCLYLNSNIDIVKFVLDFTLKNYKTLFSQRNIHGQNFFQLFLSYSKDLEIIKCVFDFVRQNFPSFIKEKDNSNQTIVPFITDNTKIEIIKYMFETLKIDHELFNNLDVHKCIYLHYYLRNTKNPFDIIKYVFDFTVENYPQLLKQKDNNGNTILNFLMLQKDIDVVAYIFQKVKMIYPEIIKEKTNRGENILKTFFTTNNSFEVISYILSETKDFNLEYNLDDIKDLKVRDSVKTFLENETKK